MKKPGKKVAAAVAATTLVTGAGLAAYESSRESGLDYLQPSHACGDIIAHTGGPSTESRVKSLATAIRQCYDRLTPLYKTSGEANTIRISVPVADGRIDYDVMSKVSPESPAQAYIDGAWLVSADLYTDKKSNGSTGRAESVSINNVRDIGLYQWYNFKPGSLPEVRAGVLDEDNPQQKSVERREQLGEFQDIKSYSDPGLISCAQFLITRDIGDVFNWTMKNAAQAPAMPQIPEPQFSVGCSQAG